MGKVRKAHYVRLLLSAAVGALTLGASAAWAESKPITIPAQSLSAALHEFGSQTGRSIMFSPAAAASKETVGVNGVADQQLALTELLEGTGLTFRREGEAFVIVQAGEGGSPQSESAGGDGAEVEALVVTAQKREEAIQDVPIAISAFTQKDLEAQKIEGGFDLLKAIPNVTFSKTNFSSYNFSIRGVGTKAVSATTDPGVAVAFNNTSLLQNRLFEQEYFDIERVEVLRGPQGTLYGRNATSGVINVISAKPRLSEYEGSVKLEVGNYDTRRAVGMLNIPIVDDVLAIRLAGAITQRTGYDYNEITGRNINGRDLWSGRVTIGFQPFQRLRGNLLWEHFEEDDDRSRTGKQLCHRDPGLEFVGEVPTVGTPQVFDPLERAFYSQGCKAGSLYDTRAFGTPNGLALPFLFAALTSPNPIQFSPTPEWILRKADPYAGLDQSRDLRTIASVRDPIYRAKADVFDLSLEFDINESLTLNSQTVYNKDEVYSFQDYNRFNSFPAFTDTTNLNPGAVGDYRALAPGGVFCDPQIGCTDRVAGFDISQATGEQFSQELRLQSDFDGPVNFSIGANYTAFETLVDYYVMYNVITAIAMTPPFNENRNMGGVIDPTVCAFSGDYFPFLDFGNGVVSIDDPSANCIYIDPNPVESINGDGHNYFRSKNPYELESQAAFGEIYWNVNEALKVTAGLRYTKDEKTFTPVPSQVLLAPGLIAGGTVNRGYPEKPDIVQEWGEWSGRLGVDWKPVLSFTDETMLYAFYSRGYKGGGANPPSPGFATMEETIAYLDAVGGSENWYTIFELHPIPVLSLTAVEYGPTFEPEFVDALEVGSKNTLLGGSLTLNTTAFFYDYKDYQVSQIRDRTAVNENFDATIWGLEFETVFAPSRDFRINANLGYLDTKIADGEASIDIMDRTQSNPNYVVVKPWVQLPSNCVIPLHVAEAHAALLHVGGSSFDRPCGGLGGFLTLGGTNVPDPNPLFNGGTGQYDVNNYPELNGGAGLHAQLGGNELPNAPHWTTNIGAQYGRDILDGSWRVTLRGDAYWQSQSWARVYNAVNDKLHGWYNVNVAVRVENEDLGVEAEFYVKNLLDKSPITDAFLNSDDTGLTTNVFVLDPRLVGFNVRKTF